MALLLVVIMTFVALAGCLSPYPSGSDTGPRPFTIDVQVFECYMIDVGRWNAQVGIRTSYDGPYYKIEDLILDGNIPEGDGSSGPAYMYIDTYGDGILSTGDTIDFFNLSADDLTNYSLRWRTDDLVEFTIEWDEDKRTSYLITISSWPTWHTGGDFYHTELHIYQVRTTAGLTYEDIDMSFIGMEGVPLIGAEVQYDDKDQNGRISKPDIFDVNNMTVAFEHAKVIITVGDQLVGTGGISGFPNID